MSEQNETDTHAKAVATNVVLEEKHRRKDYLIRQTWLIMRDISDHADEHEMTDEDLKVWDAVTKHSAIQDRL